MYSLFYLPYLFSNIQNRMIKDIINTFRELARKHKLIKSFYYNRNYELGEGNELHPVFWLEDPIYSNNSNGNGFLTTVNFSILLIPNKDLSILDCQDLAFSIGLNIIEKLKNDEDSEIRIKNDWSFITLSNYYDNNAAGIRFTAQLYNRNMSDYCLLNEHFDEDKEFETNEVLNDFTVNANSNCEVFSNKILDFKLKTKK